ncbi:MAG TPA: LuxR C-terminal-related transcriptional regulator [Oscillospiraceae bacterium]|nr:LuxR C-terminal-related transcriptional regulator [Oscillospiraceae bacterium]HXK77813.1 LuxR C-terminal-related transcriptional regulator [Oscillospiraceae bacterium]
MLDRELLRKAQQSIAASDYGDAVSVLCEVDMNHLNDGERGEIESLFYAIPEEYRAASPIHCVQEMQFAWYEGRNEDVSGWYSRLLKLRSGCGRDSSCRSLMEKCICRASFLLPKTDSAKVLLMLAVLANDRDAMPPLAISATANCPSVFRGGRDFSVWGQHYGAVAEIVRPMIQSIYGGLGAGRIECAKAELLYEKNNIPAASMEIGGAFIAKDVDILFAVYAVYAKIRALDPSGGGWQEPLSRFGTILEERGADWLMPNYEALRIRFSLLDGNTEEAEAWLTKESGSEWDGIHPDNAYRMMARARVYLALGKYTEAVSLGEELRQAFAAENRTLDMIECGVMEAIACERLGSDALAMERLGAAILSAETYGYIRAFADFGAPAYHLLLKYGRNPEQREGSAKFVAQLTESAKCFALLYPDYLSEKKKASDLPSVDCTAAEIRMLRLLEEGKTNSEIAEEVGVKLTTVKFHLRNVYERLGVSSRTAALKEAKARGVL